MSSETVQVIDTALLPRGFRAAGVHAGIKMQDFKDMALILSDVPAAMAGVFTTNQVKAASVKLCRERLAGAHGRAVVVNSGNANACTGEEGLRDARRMAELAAELLGLEETEVYVCSTGKIGVPLPMDLIEAGIHDLAEFASENGALDAAHAIMTTDTTAKHAAATLEVDGQTVTVSAIAKGAGMIQPDMATMLGFVMTDAKVAPAALQAALLHAVNESFNRITVDGDRSTNDTVLCFANGEAGNADLTEEHAQWQDFVAALKAVTLDLARRIVMDGEGSTKFVTVRVSGAASAADAEAAARAVANSIEVKASWTGATAAWGRVMHALGYSSARVEEGRIDIFYDGVAAARNGQVANGSADELSRVVSQSAFGIDIHLNLGAGEAVIYSCDCTEDYIRMNTY